MNSKNAMQTTRGQNDLNRHPDDLNVAGNRHKQTEMNTLKETSSRILVIFESIGLLIIALSTIIAIGFEVMVMVEAMKVTLADLLLLFIYLEVLTMVGIYLKTGQLPVRVPLYIAIVAIARYVILDMKNLDTWRLLGLAGAVLLVSLSVLVIRYGHNKFPYDDKSED